MTCVSVGIQCYRDTMMSHHSSPLIGCSPRLAHRGVTSNVTTVSQGRRTTKGFAPFLFCGGAIRAQEQRPISQASIHLQTNECNYAKCPISTSMPLVLGLCYSQHHQINCNISANHVLYVSSSPL